jgi:hypothetical protein
MSTAAAKKCFSDGSIRDTGFTSTLQSHGDSKTGGSAADDDYLAVDVL